MSEINEEPLVLLFGAAELRRPLRERHLLPWTARSMRHLLRPKEDLAARAIVIGAGALGDLRVSDAVPQLRERWPMVDVVVWAHKASGSLVREALTAGARDVVMTSSADGCAREVARIVQAQQILPRTTRIGAAHERRSEFEGMYARSSRMWDLFDTTTRIAATDATVLILGETGTGKELLARAIHRHSQRRGRFVPLNCGAVDESLLNAELFGHVKGAFTGATDDKPGLFRHADTGTLFLDEIGNVPKTAQYHLLRALQERTIRPVGGHDEHAVDVRVIAATSNPLEADVRRGRFREDLFYRLDVIQLDVPPLRERPEDIVFLFAHFARKLAREYNVERPDLRDDFIDALTSYTWPGNVRQLENFTERLVLTCTGQRIGAPVFRRLVAPDRSHKGAQPQHLHITSTPGPLVVDAAIDTTKSLEEVVAPHVEQIERAYLEACLRRVRGRVGEAAKQAGISRRTLLRKMNQYHLDKHTYRRTSSD